MIRKFAIFIFTMAILLTLIPAGLSFAAQEPAPEVAVDSFGVAYGAQTGLGQTDIRITIARIIRVALGLLGIIALILIIYGGVRYMTAGGDDQKVQDAKKIMVNAAIGLAIILSALAIVQFIFRQLSDATGSGQPGLRERCADPIFFNQNPQECAPFFPINPDDDNDPEAACFDVFVAKSLTPNTAATSINDIKIRAVFSKDIDNNDPAEALNVYRQIDGQWQLVSREFRFEFRGGKSVVEAIYDGANDCAGVQCSVQGEYRVEVSDDVRADGQELQVNVDGCPIDLPKEVNFTIDKEDTLDDQDPEVVSLLIDGSREQDVRLVRGRRYTISAANIDNAGAGYARLQVTDDDAGTTFTHFDGPRVVDTSDATVQSPYAYRYRYAISPEAEPLKRYTVGFTIYDIDGRSTTVQSSFVIVGEHCDNGIVDGDEPGPDADVGGSCGHGPGEVCEADWQCADAPCIEGVCAEGFPKILDVSPWSGAAGNYVTILGKNFGNEIGSVTFYVDDEDDRGVAAQVVQCVNGHQPWNDEYIIVEAPADGDIPVGGEASIEVTSGARPEFSDKTTDGYGPIPGPSDGLFTKNDVVLPGICDVVADSGARVNGRAVASPGEGVTVFGNNFGVVQGNSTLYFDRAEGVIGGDDWNDTQIGSRVPLSSRGVVPVQVEVGDQLSNALPLGIIDPEDTDLPQIAFVSPSSTTRGSLITVTGEGFGRFKNKVFLAPSRDADCSQDGVCIEGDLSISSECEDDTWKSTQVVFRVPENDVELGTYYVVVAKIGGFFSREYPEVEIVEGGPRPGICSLSPQSGPAPLAPGAVLTIKGVNFDNTADAFFFKQGALPSDDVVAIRNSGSWLTQDISVLEGQEGDSDIAFDNQKPQEIIRTPIPFNPATGLSMSTGPIRIGTDAGISNGLQYTVFNCLEVEEDEIPEGFQCCQEGLEAGMIKDAEFACAGEVREAGYVYRFTTGKIPQPPYVEEGCEIPSPSPWVRNRNGRNACLNADVTVRFSTEMDPASMLAGGDLQNVHVFNCGQGESPVCSYQDGEITDSYFGIIENQVFGNNTKDALILRPKNGGVLPADSWVRVVLTSEVKSNRLEIGLGGEQRRVQESLLPTRALSGFAQSAYYFDFKTTSVDGDVDGDGVPDNGLCTIKSAYVLPPYVTTYVLGLIQHPTKPNQPLYYYVKGKANQECTQINVDGLGWDWSIDNRDLAGAQDNYATVVEAVGENYIDSRAQVTARQHTNGRPIDVLASLDRGAENAIVGTSTLVIALADPKVIAWEPDCVESCINAAIALRFNVNLDPDTFGQGIRVYKCLDANCAAIDNNGTLSADDYTFTRKEKNEVVFQPNEHLEPDTYYKVSLNGPETGAAIVAINKEDDAGNILERGKPLEMFEWVFKTNDNPEPCAISQVRVIPAEYRARQINEKAYYTVAPLSAANECSSRGQYLNPYDYGWSWVSEDEQVATVSDFNTDQSRKKYCSDNCLPKGSDVSFDTRPRDQRDPAENLPVCGDGIVEVDKGEQCDIADPDEQPGVSCSLSCVRPGINRNPAYDQECVDLAQRYGVGFDPNSEVCNRDAIARLQRGVQVGQCGDGAVDTDHGEQCDPGSFQNAANETLVVNNDPFCSSSCTLKGSVRFDNDDDIPVYENYAGEGQNVFASNCGDGEQTLGESCDYNHPDQILGCSPQCLLVGSRLQAAWCQQNPEFSDAPQCADPLSICGNGIIEFGEECEPGVGGAVGPAEGRPLEDVTCNARCLVQNACGTPLAQCNPFEDSPQAVGCNIDCTYAGSSLVYGEPSLCGDGRLGVGEYRREEQGNIVFQCEADDVDAGDRVPGNDPSQVVTAVGQSLQANEDGAQSTIIRATQVDGQGVPVERIQNDSNFYLQCGFEEFAEKRQIGLDGGFLPQGNDNVVPDPSFEDNRAIRSLQSPWQDIPFAPVEIARKSNDTAFSGVRSLYVNAPSLDQRDGGMLVLHLPQMQAGNYQYTFKHKIVSGAIQTWASRRDDLLREFPGDGQVLVDSGIPAGEEPEVISQCANFNNICSVNDNCGVVWDSSPNRNRSWVSQNIGGWNLCRTLNFPGSAGRMFYVVKKDLSQYAIDGNEVPLIQHYGAPQVNSLEQCRNIERYRDEGGQLNVGFVEAVGSWDGVLNTDIRTINDENQLLQVLGGLSTFKGPEPGGNRFYAENDVFSFEQCLEVQQEEENVDLSLIPWQTTKVSFTIPGDAPTMVDIQLGVFGEVYIDDFSVRNTDNEGDYNNCPYEDGNSDNSRGVGVNSCCYPRSMRIADLETPRDGQGIFDNDPVCRNPLVSVTFDGLIEQKTVLDSVLVARGYSEDDAALVRNGDAIGCPVGQFSVSDLVGETYNSGDGVLLGLSEDASESGFFARLWTAIKAFFIKYVWDPVFASTVSHENINVAIWCAGQVRVTGADLSYPQVPEGEKPRTTVRFSMDDVLGSESIYAFILQGGITGIRDTKGVGIVSPDRVDGIHPIYDSVIFKTGPKICKIDHISVTPSEYLFTVPATSTSFVAQAIHVDENSGFEQEIASTPSYQFEWSWQPQQQQLFDIPVEGTPADESQVEIASTELQGKLSVNANAEVIEDVDLANNHVGKVFSGYTKLISDFCENPWPARAYYPYEDGVPFEKIISGEPNNDGFDNQENIFDGSEVPGVSIGGNEEYFNFSMSYCADAGVKGNKNDDLPYFRPRIVQVPDVPKVCQASGRACETSDDCAYTRIREDRNVVYASSQPNVCHANFTEYFLAQRQIGALTLVGIQYDIDTQYACANNNDCTDVVRYGGELILRGNRENDYSTVSGQELAGVVANATCSPLGLSREACVPDPGFAQAGEPLKQYIMFSDINDDAIAVEVYPNPLRATASQWYTSVYNNLNDFRPVNIAGFDAISNDDQYYINALNIDSQGEVRNYIYHFAINENAQSNSREAFKKLVESLEFNINLSDFGYCSIPEEQLEDGRTLLDSPKMVDGIQCATDFDCRDASGTPLEGTSGVCANAKTKLFRDWDRLANLATVQEAIADNFASTGQFPELAGGTFIPRYTNSRLGSWNERFSEELGDANLVDDPINEWAICGHCNNDVAQFCTTDEQCGDGDTCKLLDPQTCWDEDERVLVCPAYSQIFEYSKEFTDEGGHSYLLHGQLEYFDPSDSIFTEFVTNPQYFTEEPWCQPNAIHSPFGESCGDGIVNVGAGEQCDPPGQSTSVTRTPDGQCDPGNRASRTCNDQCQFVYGACEPVGQCGNGVVEAGEFCDDGALNGQYGQCNDDCNGNSGAFCGNGRFDRNDQGTPVEFCETIDLPKVIMTLDGGSKVKLAYGSPIEDVPTQEQCVQEFGGGIGAAIICAIFRAVPLGYNQIVTNPDIANKHCYCSPADQEAGRCIHDPSILCQDNNDCSAPAADVPVVNPHNLNGVNVQDAIVTPPDLVNYGTCRPKDGNYGSPYAFNQEWSCAANCRQVGGFCGDGLVQRQYEQCDDGNDVNNDGCNTSCEQENLSCIEYTPAGAFEVGGGKTTITKRYDDRTFEQCIDTTGQEICNALGLACDEVTGLVEVDRDPPYLCVKENPAGLIAALLDIASYVDAIDTSRPEAAVRISADELSFVRNTFNPLKIIIQAAQDGNFKLSLFADYMNSNANLSLVHANYNTQATLELLNRFYSPPDFSVLPDSLKKNDEFYRLIGIVKSEYNIAYDRFCDEAPTETLVLPIADNSCQERLTRELNAELSIICNGEINLAQTPAGNSIAGQCGDGIKQEGEACDLGGEQNGVPCDPQYGETCNYCNADCSRVLSVDSGRYCGNGQIDALISLEAGARGALEVSGRVQNANGEWLLAEECDFDAQGNIIVNDGFDFNSFSFNSEQAACIDKGAYQCLNNCTLLVDECVECRTYDYNYIDPDDPESEENKAVPKITLFNPLTPDVYNSAWGGSLETQLVRPRLSDSLLASRENKATWRNFAYSTFSNVNSQYNGENTRWYVSYGDKRPIPVDKRNYMDQNGQWLASNANQYPLDRGYGYYRGENVGGNFQMSNPEVYEGILRGLETNLLCSDEYAVYFNAADIRDDLTSAGNPPSSMTNASNRQQEQERIDLWSRYGSFFPYPVNNERREVNNELLVVPAVPERALNIVIRWEKEDQSIDNNVEFHGNLIVKNAGNNNSGFIRYMEEGLLSRDQNGNISPKICNDTRKGVYEDWGGNLQGDYAAFFGPAGVNCPPSGLNGNVYFSQVLKKETSNIRAQSTVLNFNRNFPPDATYAFVVTAFDDQVEPMAKFSSSNLRVEVYDEVEGQIADESLYLPKEENIFRIRQAQGSRNVRAKYWHVFNLRIQTQNGRPVVQVIPSSVGSTNGSLESCVVNVACNIDSRNPQCREIPVNCQ
ncbi:hypothetical protein H6758_04480 [Candidatus Nomurabacteria bacterium]|nr:hypothetical protein [Candidatus Nomurabacteria bacterium]